jgi:ring-1,2-phenylacetyl-CoA epoxidase subunit PaaB
MTDTQWPRYEVFQQDKKGRPHRNVGSVHAVDAEMALQNARDVFVRRPQTVNLWVVPTSAIIAKSSQEIDSDPALQEITEYSTRAEQSFMIFSKTTQRQSMTYVTYAGKVEASSPMTALHIAVDRFGDQDTYVWWVCPEEAVIVSDEQDIESMFAQAHDKSYRMPKEYRLLSEMMQLKRESD